MATCFLYELMDLRDLTEEKECTQSREIKEDRGQEARRLVLFTE